MKTPYELLAEKEEQELIDAIYRLALPVEKKLPDNDALARYIADSLSENWAFWLSLRLEQVEALKAALANGLELPLSEMDDALLMALTVLYRFGLADLDGATWHVNACVPGLLTLDEALKEQMRMQDALCDFMQGWLIHVGMMPMSELAARASRAVETDTEAAREELAQLCYALLVSRGGLDGMFLDEYEEPWAVHEELADPGALLERLRLPFLTKLPYPDLNADELVRAGGELGLPGDVKSYFPLLDLLRAHEAEEQLAEAVMLIENELVDEAINTLTEACGLMSLRDIEQLTEVVTDLSNAMPRWYNKGYSPDEMVSLQPGGKKTSMPGRNSPCPCGSGRKYKQCCGKHMN